MLGEEFQRGVPQFFWEGYIGQRFYEAGTVQSVR